MALVIDRNHLNFNKQNIIQSSVRYPRLLGSEMNNQFSVLQFSDKHITISTQGFTPLTVWKTVPTGCSYSDLSPGICEESLTLIDTSTRYHRSKRSVVTQENNCPCGVNSLNADDHSTFQHMVKVS